MAAVAVISKCWWLLNVGETASTSSNKLTLSQLNLSFKNEAEISGTTQWKATFKLQVLRHLGLQTQTWDDPRVVWTSCYVDLRRGRRRGCQDGCVQFLPQLYFHRGSLAHTPCPVVLRRSLVKTCADTRIQQVDQQMRFHTTRLLNTWIVLFVCRRSVNIVS